MDASLNPFIHLAEVLCKRGDDMENVARELGEAFRAIVGEGLGKDDEATVISELRYLVFGNMEDTNHRLPPNKTHPAEDCDMTYLDMLQWQERQMNAALCGPWYGMRSDREALWHNLQVLRDIIRREIVRRI